MAIDPYQFGGPDLELGPFRLWILGREFEHAQDYWDGNWLSVIATYEGLSSHATLHGPYVHLSELDRWLSGLLPLQQAGSGTAKLNCIEPHLSVALTLEGGKGELETCIISEGRTESHTFRYDIDQSYLPRLVSSLQRILREYEIRGNRG